ncbi:MAG: glutaredoxin 2 [Neisseriaceae bacterium]|nr:MAG: glutaredoxin 2 [Neisseriaceae bacterium]
MKEHQYRKGKMMKLYVYEHCPYCIKARMILGFKKIHFTLKYLLNDEEKFLLDLVGTKVVPVLEKDDGTAMTESLDIIDYIDNLDNPIILGKQDFRIQQWLLTLGDNWPKLSRPHYVLAPFPEFKTQKAIDYFTRKKESNLEVSFEELRKHSTKYIAHINKCLVNLETLIENDCAVNGILSLDDFHLFPELRNMTLFKGIRFPNKVLAYVRNLSDLSQIPLLYDYSL